MPPNCPPLADQPVVRAQSSTKIHLSLFATAITDALGAPLEFHQRFSLPFTTSLLPNTNFRSKVGVLAPGTWTDDTSMMLCLARSIARYGFDEGRQLEAYAKWYKEGEMSAIGRCFDIGGTTWSALNIYTQGMSRRRKAPVEDILRMVREDLEGVYNNGNGSLMRVLPVGLAYWRDTEKAKEYARRSSATTHPAALACEVCEMWTGLITTILQHAVVPSTGATLNEKGGSGARSKGARSYSKLDVLGYISKYPYENEDLRKHLTIPMEAIPPLSFVADPQAREAYYWQHHPILRLIAETEAQAEPGHLRRSRGQKQDQRYSGTAENAVSSTPNPHPNSMHDTKEGSLTESTLAYYPLPAENALPSSGYVLHTVLAALYCFFATDTFEAGAVMAVNLGDDADTVGAVYGGLAGCWYASEPSGSDLDSVIKGTGGDSKGVKRDGTEIEPGAGEDAPVRASHLFWSEKVREWKDGLVRRDLVDEVAGELVRYEKAQCSSQGRFFTGACLESSCCLV